MRLEWALLMELAPFGGDTQRACSFPLVQAPRKGHVGTEEAPAEPNHAGILISNWPPELEKKNFYCLSHPVHSILLRQPRLRHSLKTAYGFIMVKVVQNGTTLQKSEIWLFISTWVRIRLVLLIYHPKFLKGDTKDEITIFL